MSLEGLLTQGGLGAAEEGRVWAGLTIGPQISAGGMPGAGFGGPALCDKLLRRLTPRHVCMYAHIGARGSFRMVCGGRPARCSPGGGACPPEPCSGFCEAPGCPTPTHRGEKGLTSRSLSLAHLEVHIRSAGLGQWPRSAGGLSCPSLGHTPRSWAAVGPSLPPRGARSPWSGDPSPSLGVQ